MPTPADKATAYLNKLEADRRAAIAVSEEKAEEAKLLKARQQGFQEALAILGSAADGDCANLDPGRRRRNIPQLILAELSFSGRSMTKQQIAQAVDYPPAQAERALKRMEKSGKIALNRDGRWEVAVPILTQPNGHAVSATDQ